MNIIKAVSTGFDVVYSLQDPITIALDRWYKHDAENVIHVEHSTLGIITVRCSSLVRYNAVDKVTEEEIKTVLPRGAAALYDCLHKVIVHWDRSKDYPKDLWLYFPMMGETTTADYAAYLAGDDKGNLLGFSGHSRNLVLGLFAQSKCRVFIGDRDQTEFGRTLAGTMILRRWGLPPFSKYVPKVDKNYMCRAEPKDIPEECFEALTAIDTSPVKPDVEQLPLIEKEETSLAIIEKGTAEVGKEKHLDPYIDLAFLLEIGLDDFADELTYPYTIAHEKCPEYNIPGVQKIVLEDSHTVRITIDKQDEFLLEQLEVLFSDYDLHIIAPDYSLFVNADDDGFEDTFGLGGIEIPTGPLGIPECFDKEDQI
jgi:hypothetical protein